MPKEMNRTSRALSLGVWLFLSVGSVSGCGPRGIDSKAGGSAEPPFMPVVISDQHGLCLTRHVGGNRSAAVVGSLAKMTFFYEVPSGVGEVTVHAFKKGNEDVSDLVMFEESRERIDQGIDVYKDDSNVYYVVRDVRGAPDLSASVVFSLGEPVLSEKAGLIATSLSSCKVQIVE